VKTSDALEYFGGNLSALARAAGVSRQAVQQWGDVVPKRRARRLVRVSAGRLDLGADDYLPQDDLAQDELAVTHGENFG
jgi:hypothetical protein